MIFKLMRRDEIIKGMNVNSEEKIPKVCPLECTSQPKMSGRRGKNNKGDSGGVTSKQSGKADEHVFQKASEKKCIKEERGDLHVKCCC